MKKAILLVGLLAAAMVLSGCTEAQKSSMEGKTVSLTGEFNVATKMKTCVAVFKTEDYDLGDVVIFAEFAFPKAVLVALVVKYKDLEFSFCDALEKEYGGKTVKIDGMLEYFTCRPTEQCFIPDGKYEYWTLTTINSIEIVQEESWGQDTVTGEAEMDGTVIQLPWLKSSESYCSGGSDHFILLTEESDRKLLKYSEELYDYVGKKVKVKANVIKRVIPCRSTTKQVRQCLGGPDGSDYKCTLYEATEITVIGTDPLFCNSDANCTVTKYPTGKCCKGCEPFPISTEGLKEQEKWLKENCSAYPQDACPEFKCWGFPIDVACIENTCTLLKTCENNEDCVKVNARECYEADTVNKKFESYWNENIAVKDCELLEGAPTESYLKDPECKYGACILTPQKPYLVSSCYDVGFPEEIAFGWWYLPDLNYQIQIDDNKDFSSPIINETLESGEGVYKVKIPLQEGKYYWRIKIAGKEQWSEICDFRT